MSFFDLASLTKPLVTAPLALAHLDLDRDRRDQLGFRDRSEPLTVRQLLAHAAGLPAWLPFTGEPLVQRLERGFPGEAHPLFRQGRCGVSLYSDLGYRLIAELLELERKEPFPVMGERMTGLRAAPWDEAPCLLPDGQDAVAWALAEPGLPLPPRGENLPHDANARAGMRGHAGFGCTAGLLEAWLPRWREAFLDAMAVDTALAEDGLPWGLGLHRVYDGEGRFGRLLAQIPEGVERILVVEEKTTDPPGEAPAVSETPGAPTAFWMHLGYTGPALFVRPSDGFCLALLLNRRGPDGELLEVGALRARRWRMLESFLQRNLRE